MIKDSYSSVFGEANYTFGDHGCAGPVVELDVLQEGGLNTLNKLALGAKNTVISVERDAGVVERPE